MQLVQTSVISLKIFFDSFKDSNCCQEQITDSLLFAFIVTSQSAIVKKKSENEKQINYKIFNLNCHKLPACNRHLKLNTIVANHLSFCVIIIHSVDGTPIAFSRSRGTTFILYVVEFVLVYEWTVFVTGMNEYCMSQLSVAWTLITH